MELLRVWVETPEGEPSRYLRRLYRDGEVTWRMERPLDRGAAGWSIREVGPGGVERLLLELEPGVYLREAESRMREAVAAEKDASRHRGLHLVDEATEDTATPPRRSS
jgi:hypothetical protein